MEPIKKIKRVGLWNLEWSSHRPYSVWVIPSRHKVYMMADHGVMYEDGTTGWSYLTAPRYVRDKAAPFIRKCMAETGAN